MAPNIGQIYASIVAEHYMLDFALAIGEDSDDSIEFVRDIDHRPRVVLSHGVESIQSAAIQLLQGAPLAAFKTR